MSFVDWSSSYSVNSEKLDTQHQKLFGIINELHRAMFAKKSKEVMGDLIAELVEYTHTHFAEEEREMQAANYPGLEEHKAVHEKLVKRVMEIQHRFQHSNDPLAGDVIGFLVSDWLVKHILNTDKQYAPYLKKAK